VTAEDRVFLTPENRTPKAISYAETVLAAKVRKHGADHAQAIAAQNELASACSASGKMRQALALFEKACDAAVSKLGAKHPLTLAILNNLANMYRAFGRVPEAIALGEKVRESQMLVLGARHPSLFFTLSTLALAYQADGKPEKALPLFQQAAAGVEELHILYEIADLLIYNLCECCEQLKQYVEAEIWRRKWLAVVKVTRGPESAAYVVELKRLGWNLVSQNKHAEAELILYECLAILPKTSPLSWQSLPTTMSHTQSLLGAALLGQKKFAEAEPLLVRAYEDLKSAAQTQDSPHQGDSTDNFLIESLERVIRLYEDWGKGEQLAKWQKELDMLRQKANKSVGK
jgi:tetratricopeptide (TPR) repeat protein